MNSTERLMNRLTAEATLKNGLIERMTANIDDQVRCMWRASNEYDLEEIGCWLNCEPTQEAILKRLTQPLSMEQLLRTAAILEMELESLIR